MWRATRSDARRCAQDREGEHAGSSALRAGMDTHTASMRVDARTIWARREQSGYDWRVNTKHGTDTWVWIGWRSRFIFRNSSLYTALLPSAYTYVSAAFSNSARPPPANACRRCQFRPRRRSSARISNPNERTRRAEWVNTRVSGR